MTEIIIGERRSGKTTELIKMSVETGAHIVVRSDPQIKCVLDRAKEMGVEDKLPEVLHAAQFVSGNVWKVIKDLDEVGILLDEFSQFYSTIGYIINVPIRAVTITDYDSNLKIRRLEKPKVDFSKVNNAIATLAEACRKFDMCSNGCPFFDKEKTKCKIGNPLANMEDIRW